MSTAAVNPSPSAPTCLVCAVPLVRRSGPPPARGGADFDHPPYAADGRPHTATMWVRDPDAVPLPPLNLPPYHRSPRPVRGRGYRRSSPKVATFATVCDRCGEDLLPGEEIGRRSNGGAIHAHCGSGE